MPALKHRVTLTEEEKESLESLLRKGKSAARTQARARVLVKAAAACKDEEIIQALRCAGEAHRWANRGRVQRRRDHSGTGHLGIVEQARRIMFQSLF
jgi:hypothetical protein